MVKKLSFFTKNDVITVSKLLCEEKERLRLASYGVFENVTLRVMYADRYKMIVSAEKTQIAMSKAIAETIVASKI